MDAVALSKFWTQAGDWHLQASKDWSDAVYPSSCSSDLGYCSAGGSLSPASSSTSDSCCLSPPASHWEAARQHDKPTDFCISQAAKRQKLQTPSEEKTRRSRSRYLGKQRQSASDREKLRMRDLTKALHHLRTYLPPSVAPEGQTLTKIETLRLTIGYISHLAAQLGPGKEGQREGTDARTCQGGSAEMQACLQGSSTHGHRHSSGNMHGQWHQESGSTTQGHWHQERLQGSPQSTDWYSLPLASCVNTEPQKETNYSTTAASYQDIFQYEVNMAL